MENFKLILSCLDAIGSIAAAITLFIGLQKMSHKLKIEVEFPVKNSKILLLTVYNNTMFDNEIRSVNFYKGNPSNLFSTVSMFCSINLPDYSLDINPNTGNVIISKGSYVEIPIPCQYIACNYANIVEAIGKPYDKIYLAVRDRCGKTYHKNTGENIDFFRILGKQGETENHE